MEEKIKKKEERMKRHQIKGMGAILAVAFVLGLATSAFPRGNTSVWIAVGEAGGGGEPVKDLFGMSWNDYHVPHINSVIETVKDLEGEITTNMAEGMNRGCQIEGGVQVPTPWGVDVRAGVGFTNYNKSHWGYGIIYPEDPLLGQVKETYAGEASASYKYASVQLLRRLELTLMTLMFSVGPSFLLAEILFGDGLDRYVRDSREVDLARDASLEGSGVVWQASLGLERPVYNMIIGVEITWRNGVIPVEGNMVYTDSDEVVKTEKVTGAVDSNDWSVMGRWKVTF